MDGFAAAGGVSFWVMRLGAGLGCSEITGVFGLAESIPLVFGGSGFGDDSGVCKKCQILSQYN